MLDQLKLRCFASVDQFRTLGDTIDTPTGQLTYIDNGASVLAVGHLDYVDWTRPRISRSGQTIRCPQLDDRLGVWTILDVLPKLGINVDVLLTDSEEIGQSTAQWFDSPKRYNWMVEFDRRGTDAVLYQYDTDEQRERLEDVGFDIGRGSFSDISYLEHLGICGFNVGIGYHHEHTRRCYAKLNDTWSQIRKFERYWSSWRDTPMEYVKAPVKPVSGWWDYECYVCNRMINWKDNVCPDCGTDQYDDYWQCEHCNHDNYIVDERCVCGEYRSEHCITY